MYIYNPKMIMCLEHCKLTPIINQCLLSITGVLISQSRKHRLMEREPSKGSELEISIIVCKRRVLF